MVFSEEFNTEICFDTSVNKMRALNELDRNIDQLKKDIRQACDQIVRAVEHRKEELIGEVENIRTEKAKMLQHDFDNISFMKNSSNKPESNFGSCLRFVIDGLFFEIFVSSFANQQLLKFLCGQIFAN